MRGLFVSGVRHAPSPDSLPLGLYRIRGAVSAEALATIAARVLQESVLSGEKITEPHQASRFLQLKLAHQEREHFAALFLDNQHRVLRFEQLFLGTINEAWISPKRISVG